MKLDNLEHKTPFVFNFLGSLDLSKVFNFIPPLSILQVIIKMIWHSSFSFLKRKKETKVVRVFIHIYNKLIIINKTNLFLSGQYLERRFNRGVRLLGTFMFTFYMVSNCHPPIFDTMKKCVHDGGTVV